MGIEVGIFLAVVFGIGCGLILERLRKDINEAEDKRADAALPALTFGSKRALAARPDEVTRLRNVSGARFIVKRMMSDNEVIVMSEVESIIDEIGEAWRVLAQVNLSQIIGSTNADAVTAIEGQVAALMVVGSDRTPLAVVEYQSLGMARGEEVMRDAIKREALRRAGIAFIEVRASDEPGDLRRDLIALAAGVQAAAERKPIFARAAPAQALAEPDEPIEAVADQTAKARAPRKPRGKPASGVNP